MSRLKTLNVEVIQGATYFDIDEVKDVVALRGNMLEDPQLRTRLPHLEQVLLGEGALLLSEVES